MEAHTARTLVLDTGYAPVEIISWQRAITLLTLGKCEVLESYDGFVRSRTVAFKIPAVIRLLRVFKRFRKPVKFSRINIYARDNYSCQYCGVKKTIGELTYDHVIPRAQGGKTTWTNIVSACGECNKKKANRTPEQAGMKLRRAPAQPTKVPVLTITFHDRAVPDQWRDWAYWTVPLDEG